MWSAAVGSPTKLFMNDWQPNISWSNKKNIEAIESTPSRFQRESEIHRMIFFDPHDPRHPAKEPQDTNTLANNRRLIFLDVTYFFG